MDQIKSRLHAHAIIIGIFVVAVFFVMADDGSCREKNGDGSEGEIGKIATRKLTPEEKAKRGAELYESPDTRKEGVSLLRQAAGEGSAFALARFSALYYLGEGGFRQDYGMAHISDGLCTAFRSDAGRQLEWTAEEASIDGIGANSAVKKRSNGPELIYSPR